MSETCPKCGDEKDFSSFGEKWRCGSLRRLDGSICDGFGCLLRQRKTLNEELAALRSQLAAEKKRVEELCELFECEPDMLRQEIVEARDRADAMIRISGKKLAAERQLKEAAEARAAGLTWVNADERLPPFGSYALCQFGSEILGAGVGVCKLTGSDFMSEWIFADRFSVFVKAWMKVNALLAPAAEEGAGDGK